MRRFRFGPAGRCRRGTRDRRRRRSSPHSRPVDLAVVAETDPHRASPAYDPHPHGRSRSRRCSAVRGGRLWVRDAWSPPAHVGGYTEIRCSSGTLEQQTDEPAEWRYRGWCGRECTRGAWVDAPALRRATDARRGCREADKRRGRSRRCQRPRRNPLGIAAPKGGRSVADDVVRVLRSAGADRTNLICTATAALNVKDSQQGLPGDGGGSQTFSEVRGSATRTLAPGSPTRTRTWNA